jgi:ADP-ribose pyrophosphatase YjhB (NUDIX family)
MSDAEVPLSISFVKRVPDGDEHERKVCSHCGFIDYVNPKVVVGAVATWEDKILLCKRAIDPRIDYWTLPAGFLEKEETTEQGAVREAWEEACAKLEIEGLLAVFNVPHISQVQLIYRARLLSPEVRPGIESREVRLVEWEDIPWDELAFATMERSLRAFHRWRNDPNFTLHQETL